MSIPHPSKNHLTVAELAQLERNGSARGVIGAMSDETLAELDDRLELGLATLREANIGGTQVDDLVALAVGVRWPLHHRRAGTTLDAFLRFAPW